MKITIMGGVGLVAVTCVCLAGTPADVRVKAERVNLRARPVADSEVVAQAIAGDRLTLVRLEGDWAAVRAPTNAEAWVKAEFVKDGVAVSEKLNVRCGPGVSYRMVGSLRRGDRVTALATKGEWVRILPPTDLVLWVSRGLVEERPVAESPREAPAEVVTTTASPSETVEVGGLSATSQTNVLLSRELPAGLTSDDLAPVLGQGAVIERRGMLERVPMAFLRGVEFRLVGLVDGRKSTLCYLRGKEAQLRTLVGQLVAVRGRGYWLDGERCPLIYADELPGVSESKP